MKQSIFIRRTRDEVLTQLKNSPGSYHRYLGMDHECRELFMAFCMGKKTLPVLYDTVFKKLMHPILHPERLEDCISCILDQEVTIKAILPTEDILIDGESTMVMDILVELEDGSYVLIEIQKVSYYFPAERASCYSADLLLRQYSRVKSKKGKNFSYKDLHKVYTIIFYEDSPSELKKCNGTFVHHAKTVCNSGAELNFLQEFYLISLDVFQKNKYAKLKATNNRQAGWLSFFCTTTVEEAEALCQIYPWLSELYLEMAQFGRDPEELMSMFSEMLREMDRNTIRYMVDDMKEQLEKDKQVLAELNVVLVEKGNALATTEMLLTQKTKELAEKNEALAEKDEALAEKDEEIRRLKALLDSAKN